MKRATEEGSSDLTHTVRPAIFSKKEAGAGKNVPSSISAVKGWAYNVAHMKR